jgi:hypothetical protein
MEYSPSEIQILQAACINTTRINLLTPIGGLPAL